MRKSEEIQYGVVYVLYPKSNLPKKQTHTWRLARSPSVDERQEVVPKFDVIPEVSRVVLVSHVVGQMKGVHGCTPLLNVSSVLAHHAHVAHVSWKGTN